MLGQTFQIEWFGASDAFDRVGSEHFQDQSRWLTVATQDFLAHLALFLLLLQILVAQFLVQAEIAVQLAALCIFALHWGVYDLLTDSAKKIFIELVDGRVDDARQIVPFLELSLAEEVEIEVLSILDDLLGAPSNEVKVRGGALRRGLRV
mmetsp:Transcript_23365/g.31298  ORF Transcript_23365/g.31298 Transcript_23365/m.31298 type:complete len:150 (+) Transcript_23365:1206-1655(+)